MRENVHKNDQLIAYISVGIKKNQINHPRKCIPGFNIMCLLHSTPYLIPTSEK